jgi:hypothetical protein
MKLFSFIKLSSALLLIVLIGSCCKTAGTTPNFPIYSYTTTIVNPPSRFQVNYIISSPGDKTADITFAENSVWIVEKLGDSRVLFSINNGSDKMSIIRKDTIAFQGGKQYEFSANNSNLMEITNFLTEFNKLDLDYDSFEPKF